jgi:hypothetical protein
VGPYDLTQHAKDVITERDIQRVWLERVPESSELIEPDRDDPDLKHHVGRISEYGNRALHVVLNTSVTPIRVVTAYFDRKMRGRL